MASAACCLLLACCCSLAAGRLSSAQLACNCCKPATARQRTRADRSGGGHLAELSYHRRGSLDGATGGNREQWPLASSPLTAALRSARVDKNEWSQGQNTMQVESPAIGGGKQE